MAEKRTVRQVAKSKPKRLGSPRRLPLWEQRIKDLKAFRKEHGHCNVSSKYQPNLALGRWVAKLRHQNKGGRLAKDKILLLDALGFCWERKPAAPPAAGWRRSGLECLD